jgi:uncharacterized protein YbjT (DUF2867 family)
MKVILFGAGGMVGRGVLRECLLDPRIERVVCVVRSSTGQSHQKLEEIVHRDFLDFSTISDRFDGLDACFFCLGVSSAGLSETRYTQITYGYTLAAAQALASRSPQLTFIYVSGAGTDSSERGSTMWARVKGRTENALLRLPFKGAYLFRPGAIQALHGERSKTQVYRIGYLLGAPLLPLLRRIAPGMLTTTEQIGRAMIVVARDGYPKPILESADINRVDTR